MNNILQVDTNHQYCVLRKQSRMVISCMEGILCDFTPHFRENFYTSFFQSTLKGLSFSLSLIPQNADDFPYCFPLSLIHI